VNSLLPPWRSSIARALHRNRSLPYARYVQLATIDRINRPRNRTVVFRGWREPESQLQFAIDLRSAKAQDLLTSLNNWAEICWYFPKTREQFRISGELLLVTADSTLERDCKARQAAWQQLSDGGRISFAWAMPGADRSADPAAFNPPAPDEKQPLANFCLLLLAPTAVDHLELRGEPQNRYSYELVGVKWVVREVNP
jgi:pyridoxamine 5'-phosphate oxidase